MKLYLTIIALCITIISHAAIQTPCAKIILNSGHVIEAEILELNATEIRYKKCGQMTDVEYILSKKTVLVIKNSQDEIIFIHKADENESFVDESQKQHETFAILALIFAILSPLFGAIFAGLSTKRMQGNPQKYKKSSKTVLKWALGILKFYLGMIIATLGLFLLLIFGAFR